jgi:hypothetical protein
VVSQPGPRFSGSANCGATRQAADTG